MQSINLILAYKSKSERICSHLQVHKRVYDDDHRHARRAVIAARRARRASLVFHHHPRPPHVGDGVEVVVHGTGHVLPNLVPHPTCGDNVAFLLTRSRGLNKLSTSRSYHN